MASLTSWMQGYGLGMGTVQDFLTMFFWGFLLIAIIAMGIYAIRYKIKYRYYGEVYKRRDINEYGEPESEVVDGPAAYVNARGKRVFRIRYGWMPWQVIDIKKLPNPRYMKANKRKAFFIQYQEGQVIQAKHSMNWSKGNIEIEPVDSDTISDAKEEIKSYNGIFRDSNMLKENMGIAIMGFILIAGILSLYFVTKACG